MKRFVGILLLFIMLVFLGALCLDYVISSGLRESQDRKYVVWNDIYHGGIDADLLILGSSRAWCAYNTYIIDSILGCNSYNLGIDGHTLEYQILRYNTYCRFNKKPKTILLNVDFMSTFGETSELQYEREQFFPYILDDSLISVVKDKKHLTLFDRVVPLYRYIGYRSVFERGVRAFIGREEICDGRLYKGYRGNTWNWNPPKEDSIVHQLEEVNASVLDGFVKSLVSDGVNVIMIKEPFHDYMYEHNYGIDITDRVFVNISEKYNCLLLDYYHCYLAHDKQWFYNPSHLNAKGAEAFTRKLCAELKNIGIE